jgi:hypothetical protein
MHIAIDYWRFPHDKLRRFRFFLYCIDKWCFIIDFSKSQNSKYGSSPDGSAASISRIAVVVKVDRVL